MMNFNDDKKRAIGRRLKDLRKGKKLTQRQLAEEIGCSVHTIINYETGQFSEKTGCPDLYILLDLADLFAVSVDYLLCRSDTASNTGLSPEALQVLTEDYKDVQNRLQVRNQEHISIQNYNKDPQDFQSLSTVLNFLLRDGRADRGKGGLLDLLRAYFGTPDTATMPGLEDGITAAGRRPVHLPTGQVLSGMYYSAIQQTLVKYRDAYQSKRNKKPQKK